MYLYNYSPVYGLSAGMCFTIVGAAYIPDFLMRLFGETFKKIFDSIADAYETAEIRSESLSMLSGSLEGSKNFTAKKEIAVAQVQIMDFLIHCDMLSLKYDSGVLQKLLRSLITALFYYSLFFNGSILIVSGYEHDVIFTRFDTTNFVFILDILAAFFLFLLSVLNSTRGYKSFIASIIMFLITMVLVSSLMDKNLYPNNNFDKTEGIVITISFLVLPYCLLLLLIKITWWMLVTPIIFKRKHKGLLENVTKLENKVTLIVAKYKLK